MNDSRKDDPTQRHETGLPEKVDLRRAAESLTTERKDEDRRLSELIRPVKIVNIPGSELDERTIRYSLYNSFNYSLFLPDDYKTIRLSLGVTSPNKGEGKTTAICNLATAISLGIGRKTLILDLNPNNPRIHKIFGIPRGPGVSEAVSGEEICVASTSVENLFVMPIGNSDLLGPAKASSFRGLILSLSREFDFVLLDMPSVGSRNFPTLIANQLTGLIVVVKSRKTKRRDIDKLFRRVRKETVLAFVMNEVRDNEL